MWVPGQPWSLTKQTVSWLLVTQTLRSHRILSLPCYPVAPFFSCSSVSCCNSLWDWFISPVRSYLPFKRYNWYFCYIFTTQKGDTMYMRKPQKYHNYILPFNHRVSPECATLACLSKGVECKQKMEGLDGVKGFWWQKSLGYFKLMPYRFCSVVPGLNSAFYWVRNLAVIHCWNLNAYGNTLNLAPKFHFLLFLFFVCVRNKSISSCAGSRCSKSRKVLDWASHIWLQLHNSRELCCRVIGICANQGCFAEKLGEFLSSWVKWNWISVSLSYKVVLHWVWVGFFLFLTG